jgi:hypothetical protein
MVSKRLRAVGVNVECRKIICTALKQYRSIMAVIQSAQTVDSKTRTLDWLVLKAPDGFRGV